MAEPKRPAPLGDSHGGQRLCTRLLGHAPGGSEILCDAEATVHIIYWWDENPKPGDPGFDHGYCCAEHAAEFAGRYCCAGRQGAPPKVGGPVIFTYALYAEIAAHRKTVTRRPCMSKNGRRFNPPAIGDVLPIQRGYAKATLWARVTAVDLEPAFTGYVTDGEAHREGVPGGAADFHRLWTGIYGDEPVDVFRIEFVLES